MATPDLLGGDVGRAVAGQKLLGGTFLASVSLATIGETRGGLPPPRRYAAIVLLWFIFGLAAELGGQVARFTGALAVLVTLTMAMGTAGRRALGWLRVTAGDLQARPSSSAEPGGPLPPQSIVPRTPRFPGAYTPPLPPQSRVPQRPRFPGAYTPPPAVPR